MPEQTERAQDRANILLVDDQPAKLLAYEVVLAELGETLIKASSARQALDTLLRTDVAVLLIDVNMPELDGFELAAMIREHPRFEHISIIFVSAVHLTDLDRLKGYEAGAVDYVPVPVVPEVLRAKVRVFVDLHRKTRQLERLNAELEHRVAERTAALEAAAARLGESERRRTVALAAGQMGSWDWDIEADSVNWDAGQYRIFGLAEGTVPLSFLQLRQYVHPQDLKRLLDMIRAPAGDGATFQAEVRLHRPDGELRWCICAGAVAVDAGGAVCRISGVTVDITDRKRGEQELQRLNEELERRVEQRTHEREQALAQLFEAQKLDTIGQLTGGIAHDFNNLLMAVLGNLRLLRKRLPEDSGHLRLVDNATQGAERGAVLTQRLLAFARRQELKPSIVDVEALTAGIRDLLLRALGPAARLIVDIPPDTAAIHVDPNQLELALLNLVVNARDALSSGGTVAIAAAGETVSAGKALALGIEPGDYVRLSVADDGMGMDESTLRKAADPFFTTKGPGKGTGLGLSMVQGLAAQSKGKLTIRSEPGTGTTVELLLPQAGTMPAPQPERDAEPAPVASAEAIVAGRTILVVDDDSLVGMGTAAMLEDLGHRVLEAQSALDALALLQSNAAIQIVVTDHVMPGMTGLELIREIRRTFPDIGVVLATGFAELGGGFADDTEVPRLAKPFTQAELERAVAAAASERVPSGMP